MNRSIFLTALFSLYFLYGFTQDASQWRGPNRDGIYPETGLRTGWPGDGPEMVWHFDGLGDGHASATVTKDAVFTGGTIDGNGFIIALSHEGKEIWRTEYGKEWVENWDGIRSTPLFNEGKLYMLSSYGYLVCLDATTGEKVFGIDLFSEYGGVNIKWGITENLLIDGDALYCVPGGPEANILKLSKTDGSLIWKSAGNGEVSAYCSPLMISHNGRKIFVTMTANNILGTDANTGSLLWKHEQTNRWSVHANTPLYKDGQLYCFSGYGKGGVMLKISDDGNSIEELWRDPNLDSKMGGAVLLDGKIYGSGDNNKKWFCIDWKTGEKISESEMIKPGNIIMADGLLYCYGTEGIVALVAAAEGEYDKISSFEVPYGEKQHWAHLVIFDKRLYVRHGNSLMVYNIGKE